MKSKKEKEKTSVYQVTPQGSLGLLALGHIGIIKWKAAMEAEQNLKENKKHVKK